MHSIAIKFNYNNFNTVIFEIHLQIFSLSVASGLRLFRNFPELRDSEETEKFCIWMNNLVDALNIKEELNGVQKGDVHYKVTNVIFLIRFHCYL